MTLHQAIEEVLRQKNKELSAVDIASLINQGKLYTRGDGNPVPSSQIHARVNKYPDIFYKNDGLIGLRALNMRFWKIKKAKQLDELIDEIYLHFYQRLVNPVELLLVTVEWSLALEKIDFGYTMDVDHEPSEDEVLRMLQSQNDSFEVKNLFGSLLQRKDLVNKSLISKSFLLAHTISTEESEFVNKTLIKFISNSNFFQERKSGEITTPDFVNQLLVNITNPKEDEIVYDPAAGLHNTLLKAYDFNSKIKISGQEINEGVAELGKLNLYLHGCTDFNLYSSDAIQNPLNQKNSVDVVISNPPFVAKAHNIQNIDFERLCSDKTLDTLFFEMMLSRLNSKTGRMAVVVADGFLFRNSNKEFKKHILENDQLDTVIALPKGSFYPYAGVNASIIVINNKKSDERKNKILFINTRNSIELKVKYQQIDITRDKLEEFVEQVVNIYFKNSSDNEKINFTLTDAEKILEHNYDLSVERYTSGILEIIEKTEKEEDLFKLRDVLINIEALPFNEKIDNKDVKLVQIKDLNENAHDFYLNLNNIKSSTEIKKGYKIISTSAILIARVGNSLKPTLFRYTNQSIAINPNILAYYVNAVVTPEYLISQLDSEFIKSQYKLIIRGAGIPSVSARELLELKIPMISLREQIEKVAQYKELQVNKFKLTQFINEIRLVSTNEEIKEEIERFAKTVFKESEYIIYKNEFEFEEFPFSLNEIANGITSNRAKKNKKELDEDEIGFYTNILLKVENNKIHGVLIIDTENEITLEQYSEINAFADFLIKTREFITQQVANDSLAKFAHTSKNFFLRLAGEMKSIVETKNDRIISVFSDEYVESDKMIDRKKKQGKDLKDYLLINKLKKIDGQISAIADFYLNTDKNFKEISTSEYSNFDIIGILKDCIPLAGNVELDIRSQSIFVNSKINAIRQSIADLLQNAVEYSAEAKADLKVSQNETLAIIEIANKVGYIMPEDTYNKLGVRWLTAQNDVGISKGLYWAREAIENSNGNFELLPFEKYKNEKKFEVKIKLRKQL